MSSPVEKVELSSIPPVMTSPPAYKDQEGPQKPSNVKYIVAGVVTVVLVAMVIGAALVGVYMQHEATKDLVKEFAVASKDKDGKTETDKVKVDAKNNEEESSSGDGKLRVLEDYNRGIIVMRTTMSDKLACYLKPLNKTGVTEPKALKDYLDTLEINETQTSVDDNTVYQPASDPVEDTSFLSAHAQDMCRGLDVYWMLPAEKSERSKRGWCYRYRYYWRLRCVIYRYYTRCCWYRYYYRYRYWC